MSEMIERVARAIIAVNAPQMMKGWSALTDEQRAAEIDHGWDLWKDEARAAIRAMREPTGPMAFAAKRMEKRLGEDGPVEVNYVAVAYDIWPKMIDEALK